MVTWLKVPRCTKNIQTERGLVIVEGPVDPEKIKPMAMDPGLDAFRPPKEQMEALVEIASLPEGQIILARVENLIIGYVTFHFPEEFERWGSGQIPGMLEMGAIETARTWRGGHISTQLLQTAFEKDAFEENIVIATEYYWHWDLKGKSMTIWDYHNFLETHFGRVGFKKVGTDEPDIIAHPANMLMARVGSKVPTDIISNFEASLYQSRWLF